MKSSTMTGMNSTAGYNMGDPSKFCVNLRKTPHSSQELTKYPNAKDWDRAIVVNKVHPTVQQVYARYLSS